MADEAPPPGFMLVPHDGAPPASADGGAPPAGYTTAPMTPVTTPGATPQGENWADIRHGMALGLTAAGEGVADLPGALWNVPALGWNATRRYLLPNAGMPAAPYVDIGGMTARALGLPQPQTPEEERDFGRLRIMGGLAGSLGLGAGLEAANLGTAPATVGRVLAAQPARQAATTAGITALQENLPKDMSPEARGLISLAAGTATGLVPGSFRPSVSAIDQGLIDAAAARNIPIYGGQVGSGMKRQLYDLTGKFPGSGMEDAARTQQTALNSAVGNTFGANVDATGRLGPQAMANARAGLSNIFDFVTSRATPTFDQALQGDLNQVRYNLARSPAAGDAGVLQNIQDIENLGRGAPIPSAWLMRRTAATSPLSVAARSNAEAAPYYAQILDALHDALERSVASPADLQLLQNARTGWKNMMTVERLVAQGNGDVSGGSLNNAVANNPYQFKAYTGGGELGVLGEIGKRFIKPPPTSGTAERGIAYSVAGAIPTAVGLALAGHPLAALGTVATPVGSAIGAAAVNRALRPMPPVSSAQYYARLLANPAVNAPLSQP